MANESIATNATDNDQGDTAGIKREPDDHYTQDASSSIKSKKSKGKDPSSPSSGAVTSNGEAAVKSKSKKKSKKHKESSDSTPKDVSADPSTSAGTDESRTKSKKKKKRSREDPDTTLPDANNDGRKTHKKPKTRKGSSAHEEDTTMTDYVRKEGRKTVAQAIKSGWEDGANKGLPLVPFACPLADHKLTLKVFEIVREGVAAKAIIRGVREAGKAIRKGKKGICILGGDVAPLDCISHMPVLCEEAKVPYVFVRSKFHLGFAARTRKSLCCVLVETAKLVKTQAEVGKVLKALRPST